VVEGGEDNMAKQWDDMMKRIFATRPQDFVKWLLPGAILLSKASLELKTLTRTVFADTLYRVLLDGQEILLHVEFQKYPKANMATRVWEYNVLASLEYGCPVYSFVIYLLPGGNIPESPLVVGHPHLDVVHVFRFWNIKLWEVAVDVLKETGLVGILPLCLLTQGGKQYEVANEVFDRLTEERELLALALTFASMVFDHDNDKQWLERKITMLEDIVRDTWFYQKILKDGLEEGRKKGREEGMLQALRMVILDTIQERFPSILGLAQELLNLIQDPTRLRSLNSKIVLAQSSEDAERSLREAVGNG